MAPLPMCGVCGEYLAASEHGRRAHMKRYHNVMVIPQRRVTPEEKKQIVARVEARLGDRIITPDVVHAVTCRCEHCFNKQLDRILAGEHITWEGPSND